MESPSRVRVLHLENDPDFSALVSAVFKKEGAYTEVISVTDSEGFAAALQNHSFDLILADCLLPSVHGVNVVQAAREKCPEVPFLLMSGAVEELIAVKGPRSKTERFEELKPVVRRALKRAGERSRRIQAEAELTRCKEYFNTLTENSREVLTVLKPDGTFQFNSPSIKTILGYEPTELAGKKALSFIHSDDLPDVIQAVERLLKNPGARVTQEFRFLHRDGTYHYVEAVAQNRLSHPETNGVVLNSRDVSDRRHIETERDKAREALMKVESSLSFIKRLVQLGSWEMDLSNLEQVNRNEVRWSAEACRLIGLKPRHASMELEVFLNLVHPDDRSRVVSALTDVSGGQRTCTIEYRVLLSRRDERIFRERVECVLNEQGKPIRLRGTIEDITEIKRLEEQMFQTQRLEAIGQLAGGVAHDFNNLLTVVHGHASLLLSDETLPASTLRSAGQIIEAAERAAGLTRQLLAFSRRQIMQPRRLDLNQVLNDMAGKLGKTLGGSISLNLNRWAEPALVHADTGMMEQVLLSLTANARDALVKGGELNIRLEIADVIPDDKLHPEAEAGTYVCLIVSDNGCGIAPEHLFRIFEPFFTTKDVGKGTGLGLAAVFGIIKQHKGWIDVKSELNRGTEFRIYLRAVEQKTLKAEKLLSPGNVRGSKETVLVVEDELPVRELVCALLNRHGYQVLAAETGVIAREIWRKDKEKIDLLLTDLVMPDELNGLQLAEELRADRPNLKIIFTSGYGVDVVGKDFVLQQGLRYVQKPYDLQKLAASVRDCLDS